MELDPNSKRCNLDPGFDFMSPNTSRAQGDKRYFRKEETGKGLAFSYQWKGDEFHPGPRSREPNRNTSAVSEEDWIKSDDTDSFVPKDNVCVREVGAVSFMAWEKVPVSNLEDQMKENAKLRGLQNSNMKVFGNRREGFKVYNINVNDKTTSCNPDAFLDAESDQTFDYNGSLEPSFVRNNRQKQKLAIPVADSFCKLTQSPNNMEAFLDAENDKSFKCSESFNPNSIGKIEVNCKHATQVLDSFCNSTEFVGKGFPDLEKIAKAGDESHKENVAFEKRDLKAVKKTNAVQKGPAVDLKVLNSISKPCTEKVDCRVDWGRASAAGAGEPVSSEPSKKKNRKNKAQKKMANRTDTINAQPGRYPFASHAKSTGERSYPRGIIPISENMFPKDVRPANENWNSRGFRPASEQSMGRGVKSAIGNSCGRGVTSSSGKSYSRDGKSSSEHSIAKHFLPTSENHYSRAFRPPGEHSYSKRLYPTSNNSDGSCFLHTSQELLSIGRGFNLPNEHIASRGVRQACEVSRGKGFRPSCEMSYIKGFGPPSEQRCVKDARFSYLTTGNRFDKDNHLAGMNLSRSQNAALMSIAETKERSSYMNTLQEAKNRTRYCLPPNPVLMPRLGRSVMPKSFNHLGPSSPASTAYPTGPRQVAVVKPRPKEMEMFPRKVFGPQTAFDFIEMVLNTENMFKVRSTGWKTGPCYKKHDFLDEGEMNLQRGEAKEWARNGRGQSSKTSSEAESFRGFNEGGQQYHRAAVQHPDCNRVSIGREESEDMQPPLQLKRVNWVGKEQIGHFFISGLRTDKDTSGHGQSSCHSQRQFLTFDELVRLDGLESAIVSITDPIEKVVAKGFVARFPGSCNLHLLVNEDDRIYPEYIIVCCSCPKLIIANQVGAVKSCPKCRFVRLGIYPEMKIKCQFMMLKSKRMLRFVLISSSLSICEWENRVQFGWFHDFLAVHNDKSNCVGSSDQQNAPFRNDLMAFLTSMQISDLNVLSGIDFSSISPAVRLIHTKPGVSYTNDPSQYGATQLQKIIKNLVWKSLKKKQSLYKTERIDQRGYSILNDVFPGALSGDLQASIKRVKVIFPSFRWVNESLEKCESRERLKLLSAVEDVDSFGDLPWDFLNDLSENEDFVHNYNASSNYCFPQVLEQYETWDGSGKARRYGWCLTGSQALDTESWGDDYPVFHKFVYKYFQLSVGLFPYLRRKEHSKEVEVCAVDLCDVPLPFDPVAVVHYRHDDMPYLVLGNGQSVFCHCVGVFNKSKGNFGFIRPSPLFDGYLEPFPAASPGPHRPDVFLHLSNLELMNLPREGNVVEFFVLNQPPSHNQNFIKVCHVFSSIDEARRHFLSTIPRLAEEEERLYKEMVQAKALALGIDCIDSTKKMEEAIEDYYNSFLSSQRRGFSYFPAQQQIDAISIEPVKILNDTEWVKDLYKNRRNRGGLPHDIGGCRPRILLASFQALKYRFIKGLREAEESNKRLE